MTHPHGPAPDSQEQFPATSWTLVRRAQQAPAEQRSVLLDDLFRRYWRPLHAYFLAKCGSEDEANDLVLRLRERFVHGQLMLRTDPAKGRLRALLKVCANNLLIDDARKKRSRAGTPEQAVPFGMLDAPDGERFDPAGKDRDDAFHDVWRRDVVAQAFADVREACRQQNRERDFELFMERYASDAERVPTWQEVGALHELTAGEASNRAEWVKRRLARAIRAQVGQYAETEEEIEAEIRDLLS